MAEIICPRCAETENLTGEPTAGASPTPDPGDTGGDSDRPDDRITITCGSCGMEWVRDPRPVCPRCGGTDMEGAVKAMVEKSRGSQLSIVATSVVYLCRVCDEAILASYRVSRSPLMPDELPTG